jgi:hypothetical protein
MELQLSHSLAVLWYIQHTDYTACELQVGSQGAGIAALSLLHKYSPLRTSLELHNLYSSPSIIRIIKSRRMRWARHVARMGEKRNVIGY